MRLNFSHGDFAEHSVRIRNIRVVSEKLNKKIAVLLDTKGPEIRTIKLENGNDVTLTVGQSFTFTTDINVVGNKDCVAVTYAGFAKDLNPGAIILVDQYIIRKDSEIDTDWRGGALFSWACGSVVAFVIEKNMPEWSTAISAGIVGGVIYLIVSKIGND